MSLFGGDKEGGEISLKEVVKDRLSVYNVTK